MPSYIMLSNWTDQGIRHVKDSPDRLDAARKLCVQHGAEITAFYMTMGAYDMVIVIDAPNDDAFARLAISIAKGGNIRTDDAQGIRRGPVPKDHRVRRLIPRGGDWKTGAFLSLVFGHRVIRVGEAGEGRRGHHSRCVQFFAAGRGCTRSWLRWCFLWEVDPSSEAMTQGSGVRGLRARRNDAC